MMLALDAEALEVVATAVETGDIVVIPTDTVYGLAARPTAVGRLFEMKGRPAERTMATLIGDPEDRDGLLVDLPAIDRLADEFWPGALTIVGQAAREAPADLLSETMAIGVRCPDHPWTRSLLRRTGPLAVTSANRHGRPTLTDARAIEAAFDVGLIVDAGPLVGIGSTVVSVGDRVAVLREGELAAAAVAAALDGGVG